MTFRIDLRSAPPLLWTFLGEASARCDCLSCLPVDPLIARALTQQYLAMGVQATAALEGNALSEQEVLQFLEGTLRLPSSREFLEQEIENIVSACSRIIQRLQSGDDSLMPEQICELNRRVLHRLVLDDRVLPGEVRHHMLAEDALPGAPAEDCEYLLDRLCVWLAGPAFQAPPGMELVYAFIRAVAAHVYLAWIHPFGQGNGVTARLAEFQILLAAGVPSMAAHLLTKHYSETRFEYHRQLDHAARGEGDIGPFLVYAVRGFVDGLREQYRLICDRQEVVAWRNHIYELFRGREKASDRRQRQLALDLVAKKEPLPVTEITRLTPELALVYGKRSTKTLQRDLAVLERLKLVDRTPRGIRARREIVLGFLPLTT